MIEKPNISRALNDIRIRLDEGNLRIAKTILENYAELYAAYALATVESTKVKEGGVARKDRTGDNVDDENQTPRHRSSASAVDVGALVEELEAAKEKDSNPLSHKDSLNIGIDRCIEIIRQHTAPLHDEVALSGISSERLGPNFGKVLADNRNELYERWENKPPHDAGEGDVEAIDRILKMTDEEIIADAGGKEAAHKIAEHTKHIFQKAQCYVALKQKLEAEFVELQPSEDMPAWTHEDYAIEAMRFLRPYLALRPAPAGDVVEALFDADDLLKTVYSDYNKSERCKGIREVIASLRRAPAGDGDATEYAWVAENSDGQYLARPGERVFWTSDHTKAIRFARQCDVYAVAPLLIKEAGSYSSFYKAVEHGWDEAALRSKGDGGAGC